MKLRRQTLYPNDQVTLKMEEKPKTIKKYKDEKNKVYNYFKDKKAKFQQKSRENSRKIEFKKSESMMMELIDHNI